MRLPRLDAVNLPRAHLRQSLRQFRQRHQLKHVVPLRVLMAHQSASVACHHRVRRQRPLFHRARGGAGRQPVSVARRVSAVGGSTVGGRHRCQWHHRHPRNPLLYRHMVLLLMNLFLTFRIAFSEKSYIILFKVFQNLSFEIAYFFCSCAVVKISSTIVCIS